MSTVLKDQEYSYKISKAEAARIFERRVRARLKMGTDEFLRRYNAGEFDGRHEEPEIRSVLSLLPLISQN